MKQAPSVLRLSNTLALIFCLCFCLPSLAGNEFKIITLQHRLAEDILPSLRPIVSADGMITSMQNHLIIRTSAENMLEIEQAIAALDVIRKNLTITVRRQGNSNIAGSDASVGIRKRIGDVEIISGDYPTNNRNGIKVQIDDQESRVQSQSEQLINVADGARAFISVGQSIPFTQEWITLTQRYMHIQRITEFVEVSTGFMVRPRSIGNHVLLDITPRIAQLYNSGTIDFEELTSTVKATPGEWLNIGGIMQQKDEVSRTIMSRSNNQTSQNNQIMIRVD